VDQKRVKRKLRAIVSADVQGYSRLMGDDEVATFKTITEYREIFTSIVSQYNGRVVDSPGDNILSEFASVVDAVQCAVEIQKVLKAKNEELLENRRMIFRIGVNLGDVIHEDDRIYGDGVNIAARIESLADGGGICISGAAYEQIKNKLALDYNYLGEHPVKNISEPVQVYKVPMDPGDVGKKKPKPKLAKNAAIAVAVVLILGIAAVAVWNFYLRTPQVKPASEEKMSCPLPEKPSIAVLPFANVSGNPDEDYLSDGITEQIITALSKTPKSSVIARNSVFTYKGKPVKVQEVAKDLGVRYILEGSVQKSGKRLRITAQLIDAKTGNHLWAEKYDRELKDIFELQDDITKNVIMALQVQLTDGETARIYGGDTKNVEAFLKVVKGRHHVLQLSRDENLIARKLYEEAIRLDPKYSRAYTALGWTYWHDGHQKWTDAPARDYEKALRMGQKAHSLDAADSGPLMLLAWVHASMGHPGKALEAATKGISLEPHLSEACWSYGGTLRYIGRFKEAIPWIEKGIRLDPIPPWWSMAQLAYCYYALADNEKVFDVLNRAVAQRPRVGYYHALRSLTLLNDGKPHEALSAIVQARSLLPQVTTWVTGTHAMALHATGNSDEALALMEDSVRNHPDDPDALGLFGLFLGILGRHEEGTLMAEKAAQLRPGPKTRLFLGRQYVVSSQYEKAIFELKEAARLAPEGLHCHIWLAAAWSLSGNMKKARAEIAEVYRLNPDYSLERFRRDCYNAYPPEDRKRIVDALEKAGLK
jgi:adenylate cyclase